MKRFIRAAAVAMVLAVLTTACGGGSTDVAVPAAGSAGSAAGAPTASTSLDPNERADDLAEILVAAMGDGTAVEALLLAVDAGYSADQIDAGIRAGALNTDGVITAPSGEVTAPDGSPAGLILDDRATGSSAGLGSAAPAGPAVHGELELKPAAFLKAFQELLPIGQLRQEAEEIGATLGEAGASIVLRMITGGFDQEAIVETLVFGGYSISDTQVVDVEGQAREVNCPYTRTPEDPTPIHVARLCWYDEADGTSVYVPRDDLAVGAGSSQSAAPAPDAADSGDTDVAEPAGPLRTWEGRFVDTRGSGTWSNVSTTLVLVEEQADGSFVMRRQTDSVFEEDPAVFANPCPYVYFDTGNLVSPANRPLDSLRFEGTREGVYEEGGDCEDLSGPDPGTFPDLVTGSLDGDVLTLNNAFDGVGPVVLDPPTTN